MTDLFTRYRQPQTRNAQDAKGRPLWVHKTACGRCGGAGGRDEWRHTGWTCFQCGGSGTGPVAEDRLYTAEELDKLDATAAKAAATRMARKAREQAKRDEADRAAFKAREATVAVDPLFVRMSAFAGNDFIDSLIAQMRVRDLSDTQVEAAIAAMDRREADIARAKASRFVGNLGDRITVTGTVEGVRCIHEAEGYWDRSRWLIKIRTDDGALLTWFTSSSTAEGAHITGTATVKDHTEFRGERQTVIKNPRWKEAA